MSHHHNNLGLDYYEEALSHFDEDRNVVIFSDDPEWCKEQSLFESDRFLVAEGNINYVDLCLMSLCKAHIIANSSFSWWGAWLAKSEKVIAPSKWFPSEFLAMAPYLVTIIVVAGLVGRARPPAAIGKAYTSE